QPLTITSAGTFVSGVPGKFIVTAEIAGRKEQVKVTVTGEPRRPNLKSRSEESKSSREPRRTSSLRAPIQGDQEKVSRRTSKTPAAAEALGAASAAMASRPAAVITGEDETGWNSGNHYMMDRVGSERGAVPGRAIDGGVGSSNFQFAAPGVVLD